MNSMNATTMGYHPASPPPTPSWYKIPANRSSTTNFSTNPAPNEGNHVPLSTFTVEELSEADPDYTSLSNTHIIHPDELEELSSTTSTTHSSQASDTEDIAITRHLQRLRCSDRSKTSSRARRKPPRAFKRTHSQTLLSNYSDQEEGRHTDEDDDQDVDTDAMDDQDVPSRARRLRRRLRSPTPPSFSTASANMSPGTMGNFPGRVSGGAATAATAANNDNTTTATSTGANGENILADGGSSGSNSAAQAESRNNSRSRNLQSLPFWSTDDPMDVDEATSSW